MTAAKVMEAIARLPDCDGQAADAVSAYTGKDGGCCQIAQNSSQNAKIYGYVFHDTNGQNLGHTSKIQWFLSNEIYTDTHSLVSCGKDSWDVHLFIENKDYSYRKTWTT